MLDKCEDKIIFAQFIEFCIEVSLMQKIEFFFIPTFPIVGAFSGRIGLPPTVMGWAASCDDGP